MEKYTRDLQRTNQHVRDRPEAEDPTSVHILFAGRGNPSDRLRVCHQRDRHRRKVGVGLLLLARSNLIHRRGRPCRTKRSNE